MKIQNNHLHLHSLGRVSSMNQNHLGIFVAYGNHTSPYLISMGIFENTCVDTLYRCTWQKPKSRKRRMISEFSIRCSEGQKFLLLWHTGLFCLHKGMDSMEKLLSGQKNIVYYMRKRQRDKKYGNKKEKAFDFPGQWPFLQ